MDISGIVKELLSARSYRGKDGSDVRIYGFVLHVGGQYPKDIAFSVRSLGGSSSSLSSSVPSSDNVPF